MVQAGALQVVFGNSFLVFFIYGLSFFLMGFGIALQARRSSTFRLGWYLWMLAGFGLLHGVSEWAYIFYHPGLDAGGWQTFDTVLNSSHAILVAISFAFLYAFGLNLLIATLDRGRWLKGLPFLVLAAWLWFFLDSRPSEPAAIGRWLTMAEIASRYLMALPGAILTSVGLYLQRGEIRGLYHPPIERALLGASVSFAFYGFAGGLVVPYMPFFPASLVNTSLFMEAGLPVQLIRAAAGVFMAFFIIRSLDMYEVESRNRLEDLRQREIIWLEKDRIRRDLHDGVVQSIYGLSLGLDQALKLLKKDPGACQVMLKEMVERADAIIARLRNYLRDLKTSPGLPGKALIIIEDLLADFTATTGITPVFSRMGKQEKKMAEGQADQFYHMAAEILGNVRRHSGASKVEVSLDLGKAGVRLNIRDNGVGFVPADIPPLGMGLDNLRVRAARAGGWVQIRSAPESGTEVTLWLPYDSQGGEIS